MKKYFLSIVALAAMLFATSCQESIVEPQVGGTTTFTVQLPDGMGTKATTTIGGYDLINRVYVEVYSEDGTQLIYKPTNQDGTFYFYAFNPATNSATIRLNLIQDQKYDIVFWAQHDDAYDVTYLTAVKRNDNCNHHNSETGAAFFAKLDNFKPGDNSNVELRRPFAQLNLGTTQRSLSTDAGNYKLKSSTITVSTVAENFNTLTGVGVDQDLNPTTYTATIDFSQDLTVGGQPYTYVSMDYLSIPSESKILVNIDAVIVIEDENDNTKTKTISHSFESVPIQENYRTNIVGNLISSTTDFVVEVNDDWAGPDYKYDSENGRVYVEVGTVEELQNAINDGVDNITLTENIELTETLVFGEIPGTGTNSIARTSTNETSFVLDLGGKTITTSLQSEGRHHYAIDNYANLTIVGKGAINARGIQNFGTMTIDGDITITNVDINGGAAIWNERNITINRGTFTTNNQAAAGSKGGVLHTTSGGKAIVNGGTFIANSQLTYAILNYGETIINNAIVKGRHGAVGSAESSVTEIYGGSFELMENPGVSDHCTYYVSSIYGGQFTLGNNTDSGAQVFYESDIADGYIAIEDNGVWTVGRLVSDASELKAALTNGGLVVLGDNIQVNEDLNIENVQVILDLNGKTITATENNAIVAKNGAKVTLKSGKENGEINAYEAVVRALGAEVIIESGEYTQTGTAVGGPSSTYRYAIDSREGGKITINGGEFTSGNGMINVSSAVEINGGKFTNIVEKTMTRHFAYVSSDLTINGGEFYGKANSSAGGCFFCGAAASGKILVTGGKFTSLWTSGSVNRIFESYSAGSSIQVTGGLFNTNGGIATFVIENTDEATKAAYPYVAK